MRTRTLLFALGGATLLASAAHAAAPASAAPELTREGLRFLGRLHPMIVHFPVALLVTAGVLELLALRAPSLRPSARACLYIGALSSLVAAGMGWLNAAHEPHSRTMARVLEAHRWTGLATAGVAVVAALLALVASRSRRPTAAAAYRYGVFAGALLVGFTGHLGGALVYGDGYALEAFSWWRAAGKAAARDAAEADRDPTPSAASAGDHAASEDPAIDLTNPDATDPNATDPNATDPNAIDPNATDPNAIDPNAIDPNATDPNAAVTPPMDAGPVDFLSQVRPIFEARCFECHGPDEQEGDLALHQRAGAFPDERDMWTILPGDAAGSLLVELIELPTDDPDFMPAEADPLSPAEIALIRRWIDEGASWPEG